MTETITKEETKVKPLVETLPKKRLHEMYGICFDKKETYTITVVPVESLKARTIHTILKTAGLTLSPDKKTVMVYRWAIMRFAYKDTPEIRIDHFDVTEKEKVGDIYSTYKKGSALPNFAYHGTELVIIQADANSLRYPKYDNYRDELFYVSRNFNDDSSLTERVKVFDDTYINGDEEVCIRQTVKELLARKAYNTNLEVAFINSGKKLDLRFTWGDSNITWGEVIDKSGYNRHAKLIKNHFKLQELKADKVRKAVKENKVAPMIKNIKEGLSTCKHELSLLVDRLAITNMNMNKVCSRSEKLGRFINRLDEIVTVINEIGTKNEYTPHTMDIITDLEKLQMDIRGYINEVRTTA